MSPSSASSPPSALHFDTRAERRTLFSKLGNLFRVETPKIHLPVKGKPQSDCVHVCVRVCTRTGGTSVLPVRALPH